MKRIFPGTTGYQKHFKVADYSIAGFAILNKFFK